MKKQKQQKADHSKPEVSTGRQNLGETNSTYHIPVMLKELVDALNIKPDGTYVDCTLGGGGHSREILSRLGGNGRLIAFDHDADASANLPEDERITFISQNFRHLKRFLRLHDVAKVDGIIADLGVSSHHFDKAQRGFSIRFDADLDMRMDQRQASKASDVISTYSESRLHKLFEEYGEVTNAKTLARKIVEVRDTMPLRTTTSFMNAIREIVKGNPNKYFAQIFQALRIEVNDELGALKEMLAQVPSLLMPGGRIAILTFHSLEDRLVKIFFKQETFEQVTDNPFSISESAIKLLTVVTRKPILPSQDEMKRNSRARSAKLRIAEKN
jgi:16S rRNA (cytosine1402-N4)-methyltransferase